MPSGLDVVFFEEGEDRSFVSKKDEKLALEWKLELIMDVPSLINKAKKDLAFLKGGSFIMGDWGGPSGLPYEEDEESKPAHKVTLDSFSMQKHKVTYAEFDVFTHATNRVPLRVFPYEMKFRKPNFPAAVNWYGAKAYCQWLAGVSKQPFDLPTEAQWEYAARSGGKKYLYATDNGQFDEGRNIVGRDQRMDLTGELAAPSIPIGLSPPNGAGLYDMTGPNKEWANDWFELYANKAQKNPKGPETGEKKVVRGFFGSLQYGFTFSRNGYKPRGFVEKYYKNPIDLESKEFLSSSGYSFRCVLNSTKPIK